MLLYVGVYILFQQYVVLILVLISLHKDLYHSIGSVVMHTCFGHVLQMVCDKLKDFDGCGYMFSMTL